MISYYYASVISIWDDASPSTTDVVIATFEVCNVCDQSIYFQDLSMKLEFYYRSKRCLPLEGKN